MSNSLSELQAEYSSACRRLQQAEADSETNRKAWDAERAMLIERCAQASSMAGTNSPAGHTSKSRRTTAGGAYSQDGEGEGGDADNSALMVEQLQDQVRHLGQQLLKKQEGMQELLSERAGLKVRLQDAQRR